MRAGVWKRRCGRASASAPGKPRSRPRPMRVAARGCCWAGAAACARGGAGRSGRALACSNGRARWCSEVCLAADASSWAGRIW